MKAALRFGAGAPVYGGLSRHSLRAFAGNFDAAALSEAVRLCHAQGARFYAAINALATDGELADFVDTAREALEAGVDAAIVADVGVAAELRRQVPDLALHLSTQLSVLNAPAAEALRAVTGRHARGAGAGDAPGGHRGPAPRALPGHGAGGVRARGHVRGLQRALPAQRGAHRPQRQPGACAQPCRWRYHLTEEKRPGEYLPVYEDERRHAICILRATCA